MGVTIIEVEGDLRNPLSRSTYSNGECLTLDELTAKPWGREVLARWESGDDEQLDRALDRYFEALEHEEQEIESIFERPINERRQALVALFESRGVSSERAERAAMMEINARTPSRAV